MALIAGGVGGAALAYGAYSATKNGKKNLSSTSTSAPWSEQSPYLTYGFEQAKQNYQNPLQYYPNQTYVDPSQYTNQGLDILGSPNQNITAAQDQNLSTINGDYLNSNPYLQQAIDSASQGTIRNYNQAVIPGIQSQFSGAGRFGSGAQKSVQDQANYTLGQNLSNISSNMSYQNYNNERQNQMSAVNQAPTIGNAQAQNYLTAGQAQEGYGQNQINDAINRFNFNQNEPNQRLQTYLDSINGNYGGTTTGTQANPNYQTSGQQLLSLALAGAGIYGNLNRPQT